MEKQLIQSAGILLIALSFVTEEQRSCVFFVLKEIVMVESKLAQTLKTHVAELEAKGTAKGEEMVITAVKSATKQRGPRFNVAGKGDQEFLRMNSNSYLGMSLRPEIVAAEEEGARQCGVGPGGVRFICGTYQAHIDLEQKLARFHRREAAMLFSSAYVTSMGVLVPLITPQTGIISDELNHNCIINAIRLARPAHKTIYRHNNVEDLEKKIKESRGQCQRLLIVTDGIFSMRGDHAPLDKIVAVASKYQQEFIEGITTIADDSHGVGAFGETGRGTEEYTGAHVDILIGTLGKAFGVNGGYVTAEPEVIRFLRETAPMYIYSNPITVSECHAAMKALDILDSPAGAQILDHLRSMTKKFESGLKQMGYETIAGEHPVVPLMVRDTAKTADLVRYLKANGILATGLNYPVVPKGDEEIRFQISAEHSEYDINYALEILKKYQEL